MPGLTRPLLALALLLPACGPDKQDTTDSSSATTTAGPTTADTTAADTTADPSGTTADNPTTSTTAETGNTTDAFVPCPDDGLPPDGSPCATNGESCDPFSDPCAPYTYAECLDGTWHHVDVGPGDPNECDPCDPFPEEGQPCTVDGAYCNTGCEDQCQFCNILMCSEGTWNNLEAPPAPCLDCPELCPFTVMPMCAAGPPDEAACVTGCQDVMAGPCSVEFSAARACAGFEPSFSCDAAERPTVAGCETQFDELYACLGI